MILKRAFLLIPLLAPAAMLAAADPELVGLLMPDAKLVAGIHVDQARNSPFGQFLISHSQSGDQGFQKFSGLTGFDPRRDLREVLMASTGAPGGAGLVVARGTFDAAKIFAAARADGGATSLYNGIEMLTGRNGHGALAFLSGSIAMAGDDSSVRAAIDRRSSPTRLDAMLAAKVGALSASQHAWTVSIVPVSGLGRHVPDPNLNGLLQGDVLKSILQASGGVKFGAVVQFSGEAIARSDKDATALADVVRFLAGLLQTNAPPAAGAPIAALVQGLNVKADGATVTVDLGIPEDLLEKLFSARRNRVVVPVRAGGPFPQ